MIPNIFFQYALILFPATLLANVSLAKRLRAQRLAILVSSLSFIFLLSPLLFCFFLLYTSFNFLLLIRFSSNSSLKIFSLNLLIFFFTLLSYKYLRLREAPTNIFFNLGISFYLFRAFSVFLDIKNNPGLQTPSFVEYFLYLIFFPTFISGPIVDIKNFYANHDTSVKLESLYSAILLITRGLGKKVIFSQYLQLYLTEVISNQKPLYSYQIPLILFFNVVFITADLSAYTDIARGLARSLGYNIPQNFNLSLFSCNISDFWKRHHITLSLWLKNYIFFPLLFFTSRRLLIKNAFLLSLIATFIFSGFWHVLGWGGFFFSISHIFGFFIFNNFSKKKYSLRFLNWLFLWLILLSSFWLISFPIYSISLILEKTLWNSFSIATIPFLPIIFSALFLLFDYACNKYENNGLKVYSLTSALLHALTIAFIIIFYSKSSLTFLYFNF